MKRGIQTKYHFISLIAFAVILVIVFTIFMLTIPKLSLDKTTGSPEFSYIPNNLMTAIQYKEFPNFKGYTVDYTHSSKKAPSCQIITAEAYFESPLKDSNRSIPFVVKNQTDGRFYYLMLHRNFIYFGGCKKCGYGGSLKKLVSHRLQGITKITVKVQNRPILFNLNKNSSYITDWYIFVNGIQVATNSTEGRVPIKEISYVDLYTDNFSKIKIRNLYEHSSCLSSEEIFNISTK